MFGRPIRRMRGLESRKRCSLVESQWGVGIEPLGRSTTTKEKTRRTSFPSGLMPIWGVGVSYAGGSH